MAFSALFRIFLLLSLFFAFFVLNLEKSGKRSAKGCKSRKSHAPLSKEYFLHKPRKFALPDVQLGHTSIAHCCLSYILLESESEGECILFCYPAKFWSNHYKLSNKNAILQDLVTRFLWDEHGGNIV